MFKKNKSTETMKSGDVEIICVTHEDGTKTYRCKNEHGEWIEGQLGYKAFDGDWKCRGFQYEVGKSFVENYKPNACWNGGGVRGMHYCHKPADIFNYYDFNGNTKIAIVLAFGEICSKENKDKACTNGLYVIREIPRCEFYDLANSGVGNTGLNNTGDYNTGNRNTGNRNTGDYNTGNRNTGDYNTGNRNTGNYNTGNRNTGNRNTGDRNTGNRNTGDRNTGDYNAGNYCTGDFNIVNSSTGVFCTKEETIKIFDVDSGMTIEQWRSSKAFMILSRVEHCPTMWVLYSDMTEEERKRDPESEDRGGFLRFNKPNPFRYVEWWDHLTPSEKKVIRDIPNFDAEKFKLITGVDVDNPGDHICCYKKPGQYDVGDCVEIAIPYPYDGPFGVNCFMRRYNGQTAQIMKVFRDGDVAGYRLDIDDGEWMWANGMFK